MSCEVSSLASLVQKCTRVTSLSHARQLHALLLSAMADASKPPKPYVYNNVVSMYVKIGSLNDAKKVFDDMPRRNVVSFNVLISAYSRSRDDAVSALKLGAQIESHSLRPNGLTFTSLVQASSVLEDWFLGSLFHCQVMKFGFSSDQKVQTSLLGMYSNCGDLASARKVFKWLSERDNVAWNSMMFGNLKNGEIKNGVQLFYDMLRIGISPTQLTYSMALKAGSALNYYQLGKFVHARVVISDSQADLILQNALLDMYCKCGDVETALKLFGRMVERDLVSWNSVISGCAENGDSEQAMRLFVRLKGECFVSPDDYTFAAVVSATSDFVASEYGKPLHGQVVKAGFEESVFVGATLVAMYFKNGDADDAQKVFYSVPKKDVVLWTEMITSSSRLGDRDRSIRFFCEMCREGYRFDSFALSAVLNACAELAILRQGETVHSLAVKTGYDAETCVCGSLVDMYAKNGVIGAACTVFSQAIDPDLRCWNAMLGGYSHHGMVNEALEIFNEIIKHGLKPDQVTFLSLLSACNHSGLVENGKFLWLNMQENGINPGLKHYCCMVSLLSRAGLLDEAEEMIVTSPFGEDKTELWRTLLSSCVHRKNQSVGIHAAEQVLRIDPEDSATLILLSNLYGALGNWDKVSETRKKIRGLMLEKGSGLSWLEAKNNDIRVFYSGLQSQPEVVETEMALLRLQGNMERSKREEFDVISCSG